mmetsp:Transcript_101553/g.199219  ORF Transcript_101553/g.199219 Transcript_101553/m.199219 type:complete len:289 (+) Transcript_101553:70-936(+)
MIECTDHNKPFCSDVCDFELFEFHLNDSSLDIDKNSGSDCDENFPLIFKSSNGRSVGSKLRRKALRTRGEIDNNAAVNSVQCRKVVRRRSAPPDNSKPILYAFPNFDRSDSLLFLPSTLARHLNSSDFASLSKLLQSKFSKNCKVVMPYGAADINSLFTFHNLLNDIHPDFLVCVHNTKVIENKIHANVYSKFTACKPIYEAVARTDMDPCFVPVFGVTRHSSIQKLLDLHTRSEEEAHNFMEIINTDSDLLLYLHLELIFTINDTTKKIIQYEMKGRITSVKPVLCV